MTAAVFTSTDTRAVAHDMQSRAQRGLLWGIGISLLIHMAVLTVQVGGDSFGWRAPTRDVQQDSSTRFNARLVPRETPAVATPAPDATARPTEQRPSDALKTTTVTVNASSPIPRAEELDPPIPRVELPATLPPTPVTPPTPAVDVKPDKTTPSKQPPELVTPAKTEPKASAPAAAIPPSLPVTPPPVAEPAPPKPDVKEVVESPAARQEPTAPTPPPVAAEPAKAAPAAPVATAPPVPVAAPVFTPQVATPAPPAAAPTPAPVTPAAASAQPAATPVSTPVLAQPAPSSSAAPAAAAAAAASPASAAPSGASAPASAASTGASIPSTGAGGTTGRPSATVTLPSPRTSDGTVPGAPGAAGSERLPAFNMPPSRPEGFDPYKARSDVARDAARELNSQRSRVPPSVAPSLTERERMARDVENAIREDCKDLGNKVGLLALPSVISGVLIDKGCKIR